MISSSKHKICSYCGKEIEYEPCPYCQRISENRQNPANALRIGSILMGKYLIQDVIGSGGFGITYLAYYFQQQRHVAIKEFYPKILVSRASNGYEVSLSDSNSIPGYQKGLDRFFKEAKLVSSFSGHPGIVKVEEFFYENNTAYMVMEYLDGMDLKHYLHPPGASYMNKLSDGQLIFIMSKVAAALDFIHSIKFENGTVLHRDIAPDNIFLCSDGSVKLIDFGAARNVVACEFQSSVSVIIKGGFTPIEQYSKKGNQGPWTDIYSLGATIFYSATGKLLEPGSDNTELLNMIKGTSALYRVIRKCTEAHPKNRYQSARALLADLNTLNIQQVPFFSTANTIPDAPPPPSEKPKNQLWLVLGVTALTILIMVILIILIMSM